MEFTRPGSAPLHVGYCTNVHPGESVAAISQTIRRDVAAVRDLMAPGQPFGLGLRLGNEAAAELDGDACALDAFKALLAETSMYVFTVNGFPYGDFAADRVKAQVYRPDWRDPERRAYTARVARVLSALPGPSVRTISTVAGGFGPETSSPEARAALMAGLEASARDLAGLADKTGVQIRLCLEPEPFTTLETTAQALAFFAALPRTTQVTDHLGLCYDCCHQAVQFEDPVSSLRALADAGIAIGKIQVSSALALPKPADPAARAALFDFAEPRFLHQVVARLNDGTRLRALDLPDLAAALTGEWLDAESWRCHFHVPIGWRGDERLGTTRADWEAAVRFATSAGLTTHLEVETYTWGVLPERERDAMLAAAGGSMAGALAAELRALLDVLAAP